LFRASNWNKAGKIKEDKCGWFEQCRIQQDLKKKTKKVSVVFGIAMLILNHKSKGGMSNMTINYKANISVYRWQIVIAYKQEH